MSADGVIVNRQECARALGVSAPTLDKFLGMGMPILRGGSNGQAYEIDLGQAVEWYRGHQDAQVEKEREKQSAISAMQAQLDLQGGNADGLDAMPFRLRTEYYNSEALRIKVERQRGELVERVAVRQVFEAMFAFLADKMATLPDVLERRCALAPDVADELSRQVAEWQETLVRDVETRLVTLENETMGEANAESADSAA